MRRIGLFLCGLIFLFLTGICTGCGHKTETGEREIVLAAARDLVQGEKDPYYATIILKTWEPLVGISDDGHEMPVLAESWESNADKTEWIFHLKEGVRFHDGELFNAAAAIENFRRYRNMGYRPSTFYGFLADRIYPGLLRAEADDENTLHL